jgi:Flp pilus assembly protein TadD
MNSLVGITGLALLLAASSQAAQQPGAYAGSGKCQVCHGDFYQRWSTSRHGLAMQSYTPEFSNANLVFPEGGIAAGSSRYRVSDGWMAEVPTGRRFAIRFALGGKNIFYFLTELEKGRLQVMPLAFDVRTRSWLDSTASMTMHESAVPAEAVDWRNRSLTFNTSCFGCHVSQLAINYESATDTYHTRWREPGIACETCHGPSAAHVQQFTASAGARVRNDLKLTSFKSMTVQQRNDACASCHAKLIPVTSDFRPGARFFDNFGLVTLESDDYYPDGRDKRENYTLTSWLASACVRSGKLDCVHCHTSSGRYRFAGENANDACLPCHQERVASAATHSHHAAGSVASRCVSCHLPMTEYARMRRSDHSMRPPTPAASLAYGSPNACTGCHSDKDPAWADRTVRQWYPRDYQAPVLARAALIDAGRKKDWSKLPEMFARLDGAGNDEVWRASLVRLLEASNDPRVTPALVRTFKDPSPLVRSSVVDALAGSPSPAAEHALLAATRDDFLAVRIRAGAALAGADTSGLDARTKASVERAVSEYEASLHSRPDDYAQRMNLGVLYADRAQWDKALAEYAFAAKLRPDSAPARVNSALVYNRLGRNADAESTLRKAISIEPANAAAHLNLGLLLAEMGRLPQAETALRQAVKLDAANATAAYDLAVIVSKDRLDEAIALCRRAVNAAPGESKYSETLAYFLARKRAEKK